MIKKYITQASAAQSLHTYLRSISVTHKKLSKGFLSENTLQIFVRKKVAQGEFRSRRLPRRERKLSFVCTQSVVAFHPNYFYIQYTVSLPQVVFDIPTIQKVLRRAISYIGHSSRNGMRLEKKIGRAVARSLRLSTVVTDCFDDLFASARRDKFFIVFFGFPSFSQEFLEEF